MYYLKGSNYIVADRSIAALGAVINLRIHETISLRFDEKLYYVNILKTLRKLIRLLIFMFESTVVIEVRNLTISIERRLSITWIIFLRTCFVYPGDKY